MTRGLPFWFDVIGLALSVLLLTWAVWSSVDGDGGGAALSAVPAIIFAARLAGRVSRADRHGS